MGSDTVLVLDRKQGAADAKRCPVGVRSAKMADLDDHGRLTVDASGTALVCGKCGYREPTVSLDES